MNYSDEQLHDLVDRGIQESAAKIVLKQLISNRVPVAKRLQIFKHPNNSNFDLLEQNDMVIGYSSLTRFVKAIFLGGSLEDWGNFQILESQDIVPL